MSTSDLRPATILADPDLIDAVELALNKAGLYLARDPDTRLKFRVQEIPALLRRRTDPQPNQQEIRST